MATSTQVSMEIEEADAIVLKRPITRRLAIENDDGEFSLKMVVVVEDFRAGFYVGFILMSLTGLILTGAFTDRDPHEYLINVYGATNLCHAFDFPPSTYVLPVIWCFPMLSGIMYNITAILRIWNSHLEMKLSRRATVLLIIVHVYGVLSFMFFSMVFAVQPDPEDPVTMVIHTIPFLNLRLMLAAVQFAVVYFGIKVAWVGMNFPRWFHLASIIHAVALLVVNLVGNIFLLNGMGNMGANMEGKGLWWSVRDETSMFIADLNSNYLSSLCLILLPLLQALYISKNGVKNHALLVTVADNRVSAYQKTEL